MIEARQQVFSHVFNMPRPRGGGRKAQKPRSAADGGEGPGRETPNLGTWPLDQANTSGTKPRLKHAKRPLGGVRQQGGTA
jgi:hypothetical protein